MKEIYRTVAERCEIMAVTLHDRGDTQNAQLLWDAEARIRELEAENIRLSHANMTADLQIGDGRIESAGRTLHAAMDYWIDQT